MRGELEVRAHGRVRVTQAGPALPCRRTGWRRAAAPPCRPGWRVAPTCCLTDARSLAGMRPPPLQEPIIGKFAFHSGKAERQASAHGGRCIAYLFALHVTEELAVWPEAGQRTREWVSLNGEGGTWPPTCLLAAWLRACLWLAPSWWRPLRTCTPDLPVPRAVLAPRGVQAVPLRLDARGAHCLDDPPRLGRRGGSLPRVHHAAAAGAAGGYASAAAAAAHARAACSGGSVGGVQRALCPCHGHRRPPAGAGRSAGAHSHRSYSRQDVAATSSGASSAAELAPNRPVRGLVASGCGAAQFSMPS